MANETFVRLIGQETRNFIGSGINYIAKTIAHYNWEYPDLEGQDVLDYVSSSVAQIDDSNDLILHLVAYAYRQGMEYSDLMVFVSAQNALNTLEMSGVDLQH